MVEAKSENLADEQLVRPERQRLANPAEDAGRSGVEKGQPFEGPPAGIGEPFFTTPAVGEHVGEVAVGCPHEINAEAPRRCNDAVRARRLVNRDEHRRRLHRHGNHSRGSETSEGTRFGIARRDQGDAARHAPHRPSQSGS
jgi:hypothetical protein